ncbi:MAG: membrane protein insertase YidC, partial [Alphaproteobacteria bacterium]
MDNQKNLILAIVMSIGIVFLFQEYFFPKPAPVAPATTQTAPGQTVPGQTAPGQTIVPGTPGQTTAPVQRKREDILKDSARVRIATPKLTGSIALTGAVIDDITLLNYRQTIEKDSPNVVLLAPKGAKDAYFAQFGWVSTQAGVKLPDADTKWTADSEQLGPGKPVTLSWDNGQGLKFTRLYAIDENYLVSVTDRVENAGTAAVPLSAYGLMRRYGTPVTQGFFILHEGPTGVFRKDTESSGSLEEIDYSDVKKGKDKKLLEKPSIGGWLGLSDHYWLVALIPDQAKKIDTAFRYVAESDFYQADFRGETAEVKPGEKLESKTQFYVGAKELKVIQDYKDRFAIAKFDLAIDFGWFYFLTKPLFLLIEIFFQWAGNFGAAILMLTILVKALLFPLANKSYKSMSNMKKLQPELMKLRDRYKDDRQKLNQEMMA